MSRKNPDDAMARAAGTAACTISFAQHYIGKSFGRCSHDLSVAGSRCHCELHCCHDGASPADAVAIERSQIITAVSFVSQARCHSIPDEVNVASLVNKKEAFCVFQSALMAT